MQAGNSTEYIKERSKIYQSSQVTAYQKRINDASEELCLNKPNLLKDRKVLLEEARTKVHQSGYQYKKGKSRSRKLNTDDGSTTPKRRKTNALFRLNRIAELDDRIKDLNDQIGFKEKRRECASNMKNYKECDYLTEQMSTLKSERRQLQVELASLTEKQGKSTWYHRTKKRTPLSGHSSDSSTRSTTSPVSPPQSLQLSQLPAGSRLTTPSPTILVPRSTSIDKVTSPAYPQTDSEREWTPDGDTVILSSDKCPPANFSPQSEHPSCTSGQQVSIASHPPALRRCERILHQRRPTDVEESPSGGTSASSTQLF